MAIGFHVFPIHAQGDYKSISRVQEDNWCTDHGYAGVTAKDEHPQTVNSFPYCKGNDGNLYKVDMVELCRDLYGDSYANPQYWDYNNYDSWYCNRINAPAPTAVPPQPTNAPQQNNGGSSGNNGNNGGNGNSGGNGGSSGGSQQSSGGENSQSIDGDCSRANSINVSVGQQARVAYTDGTPNNVRSGPGKEYQLVAQIPEGEAFDITGGPVCNHGLRWWYVSTNRGSGWMADSLDGTYFMEPVGGGEIHPTPPISCYLPMHTRVSGDPNMEHTKSVVVYDSTDWTVLTRRGVAWIYYWNDSFWEREDWMQPWTKNEWGVSTTWVKFHPSWLDDWRWFLGYECS